MSRKKKPSTPEQKAYARGYTAGRNREHKSDETVLTALRGQVEYWRARYIALRDGVDQPENDDAVGQR